ncbi:MAG: hypothetical protein CMM25_08640 [Rhodospirillaceae bacterium]|nr:hypothetical protein [Rhodospirillaceae bacterium]
MTDNFKEVMTTKTTNAWDAGPPNQKALQIIAPPPQRRESNSPEYVQGNNHINGASRTSPFPFYKNPSTQPKYVAGRNQNKFNDYFIKPYLSGENRRHNIYYSAGVLPYARDAGGNIVFLLGKDKEGNWSDFGGRSEHQDGNMQVRTAARELYEETMGAVMPIDAAIRMLSHSVHESSRSLINARTLGGSPYYMYSLEIVYTDYRKNFKRVHDYVKYIQHKYIEKNDIRWVSRDTLLSAASSVENDGVLLPLRPIFRTTLANHIDEIRAIGVVNIDSCRTDVPSDSGESIV